MVFITETLLKKTLSGDRFWKRRRILSQAGHYYGRRKNCYSLAVRAVIRSFKFETYRRTLQAQYVNNLYKTRIDAGCEENGTTFKQLKNVLDESGIALDNSILQNLAIWEPRSFRSLTDLTKARVYELTQQSEGLYPLEPCPEGVITRGMIGSPICVKNADGEEIKVSTKEFCRSKDVYLRSGPDYSYLDGRPTSLRPDEKIRAFDHKEVIGKAFELKRELDFAKERFRKMKLRESDDRKVLMSSKLKEKGDSAETNDTNNLDKP